jgi:chromosome segregation ATPase
MPAIGEFIMQEQLQARLDVLKREFESGQVRLQELQAQQASLQQTLLRISGAIQVLEEELAKADGAVPGSDGAPGKAEQTLGR